MLVTSLLLSSASRCDSTITNESLAVMTDVLILVVGCTKIIDYVKNM